MVLRDCGNVPDSRREDGPCHANRLVPLGATDDHSLDPSPPLSEGRVMERTQPFLGTEPPPAVKAGTRWLSVRRVVIEPFSRSMLSREHTSWCWTCSLLPA